MSTVGRESRKIYYTMGEVAEMFDVNASLIRFWEQKFDILKPHKNKKGNRLFTPVDVENLKLIYHLVKENGMTLAGAQKRLKENREGVERNLEVIEKLQGIRSFLLEVRQELKGADEQTIQVFVDTTPAESDPISALQSLPKSTNPPAVGVSQPQPEPVPNPALQPLPTQETAFVQPPLLKPSPEPVRDSEPESQPSGSLIVEQTLF